MTKDQIAGKVASRDSALILAYFARYTGLLLFSIYFVTTGMIEIESNYKFLQLTSESVRKIRNEHTSYELFPTTNVRRARSFFPKQVTTYYIRGPKTGDTNIRVNVLKEYEKEFLTDIAKNNLKLSTSKTRIFGHYPNIALTQEVLNHRITNYHSYAIKLLLTNERFLYCVLLTAVLLGLLSPSLLARRKVFYDNFKVEDLALAKPCEISRVPKSYLPLQTCKNVFSSQGEIFEIEGAEENFVIYNASSTLQSYRGYYLTYDGHHYFFPEEMIQKLTPAKAA